MQKKCNAKWFDLCRFVLGAYTVLIGALFIVQTVSVYLNGTASENTLGNGVYVHPVYSVGIVAEAFAPIAWLVYGWVFAVTLMLIASLFQSGAPRRVKPEALANVRMLEARLPAPLPQSEEGQSVLGEQKRRRCILLAVTCVCAACAAIIIVYLLAPGRFASMELEPVMSQFALHVFPWIAVGFLVACVGAWLINQSALRELPYAKQLAGKRPQPKISRNLTALRVTIYVVAIALVVLGICNQGMRDVLMKAINICTECVGLG